MKNYKEHIIVWSIAILVSVFAFGDMALHLNAALFNTYNDGIKNYFTTLYFIQYDQGVLVSGMNYPFGEHCLFSDNMPILAGAVRYFGQHFSWVKEHALGIVNFTLLFSVSVGMFFTHKILRHFKLPFLSALVASFIITYMSPQLNRIFAHYGMAIVFYIPLLLFILIKYFEDGKVKYLIYSFLLCTFIAFFHLYNLAITALFMGFAAFSYLLLNKRHARRIRFARAISIWSIAGLSFAPIFLFVKLTDAAPSRPSFPYDALANGTNLNDLFVNDVPLGHVFQFLFGNATGINATEGKTYLGIIAYLLLICAASSFIYFRIKRSPNPVLQPLATYHYLLFAAFLQLLFGMVFPFNIDKDFFLDKISLFRHFRAMGRFSWPFYYVFMIYTALLVNSFFQYLKLQKTKAWAYVFLSFCGIVYFVQCYGYIKNIRYLSSNVRGDYDSVFGKKHDWNAWLQERGFWAKDFQAVLGFPFFHIGSEKIWLSGGSMASNEFELCRLSLQTQIPIINTILARTSWDQTFETVQLLDGCFNSKRILDRFNEKPILIFYENDKQLRDTEKEWIDNATFVGNWTPKIGVYSIQPKKLRQQNIDLQNRMAQIANNSARLSGLIEPDSNHFVYTNSFSQKNHLKGFADKGLFVPKIANGETVDSISIPINAVNKKYTASIWAKCNMVDYFTPYFEVLQYDSLGKENDKIYIFTKEATNIVKDWFKTEGDFVIEANTRHLVIKVFCGIESITYYGLDNLLIQPRNSVFFHKSESGLLLNNRPQYYR